MNRFENSLIVNEENFEGGLFVKVPNYKKDYSAFILTGGVGNDLVIDDMTTTKQIRKGQYKKLVEVSTAPYIKEIKFSVISKEVAYSFDVYVKAVIQVEDPLTYYRNRNLDVDAYFNNLLSMDVKRITRKYSILNFDGMDDELVNTLAAYNTFDKDTGFRYQISSVDATPGEKAANYVEKQSRQKLDADIIRSGHKLAKNVSTSYEEAIKAAVINREITELEAFEKLDAYNSASINKIMNTYQEFRNQGMLTDSEIAQRGRVLISQIERNFMNAIEEQHEQETSDFEKYYDEE